MQVSPRPWKKMTLLLVPVEDCRKLQILPLEFPCSALTGLAYFLTFSLFFTPTPHSLESSGSGVLQNKQKVGMQRSDWKTSAAKQENFHEWAKMLQRDSFLYGPSACHWWGQSRKTFQQQPGDWKIKFSSQSSWIEMSRGRETGIHIQKVSPQNLCVCMRYKFQN